MVASGVIAVVVAYLLGSIPSAYIAARLKGKDIRRLGSGNVGGFNTYRQIGAKAGIAVTIADMGKGTAAVAIASQLLEASLSFVLAAVLAVIVGHMWTPFLKLRGGMGMGTVIGVMAILLPLYGYWLQLVIFLGVIAVPLFITRNIALSVMVALLALPIIIWVGTRVVPFTILAALIFTVIWLKFLPTARAAWIRAKNKEDFFFDRSFVIKRGKRK
jgi:glycerol-3-phosphate acyltransferase PlsY